MSTLKSSAEDLTLNADGSGNDVIIQSDGSTKAIVTAEGKVGIGESSPLCGVGGLHVKDGDSGLGSVNGNFDNFIIEGDGDTGMNILAGTSSESIIGFSDTGGHQGVIRYDHSTNRMQFSTNDVTKLSILSGGGITFGSDTADANALDDYEEGTFTPTVGDADSMTQQLGIYTKVGNLVSVFIKMQCAMSSGTCWVSGLPFAAQNTDNHYSTGSFFGVVGVEDFGDGSIAPQIAPNGTEVQLYVQDNGSSANYDSFGAGHVGSTVNFSLNITYAT